MHFESLQGVTAWSLMVLCQNCGIQNCVQFSRTLWRMRRKTDHCAAQCGTATTLLDWVSNMPHSFQVKWWTESFDWTVFSTGFSGTLGFRFVERLAKLTFAHFSESYISKNSHNMQWAATTVGIASLPNGSHVCTNFRGTSSSEEGKSCALILTEHNFVVLCSTLWYVYCFASIHLATWSFRGHRISLENSTEVSAFWQKSIVLGVKLPFYLFIYNQLEYCVLCFITLFPA